MRENSCYADPEASEEAVRELLELVNLENLVARLQTARFPADDELLTAILGLDQYDSIPTGRLRCILRELERASRDKFDESLTFRDDPTIEHVLPQKWAEHWPLADGTKAPPDHVVAADDARHGAIRRHEVLKHTLGHLTLLTPSGNPRLGNLPFTKLDETVGLSKEEALQTSLLKVNQEIAAHDDWTEERIETRGKLLGKRAIPSGPRRRAALETR